MALPNTPLEVERGITFNVPVQYLDKDKLPINLTGFTAIMQLRKDPKFSAADPLYELSTVNGKITIPTPINGTLWLSIPASDSEDWAFTQAFYDLIIMAAPDTAIKLLKGTVFVNPTVSK